MNNIDVALGLRIIPFIQKIIIILISDFLSMCMAFFGRSADRFDQKYFIKNYNALSKALKPFNILLQELNSDGACHGLAINYLLFAHENRIDEFYRYLFFMIKLTDQKINELIKKDNQNSYPFFNRLLKFLEVVSAAQIDQRFKCIGAHHDKSSFIFCESTSKEKLIRQLSLELQRVGIKNGALMKVSMSGHGFAIIHVKHGFYIFDANHIQITPSLLRTEREVANTIIEHIDSTKFLVNFNIRLSISFLSYGNESRELEDLLVQFESKIHKSLLTSIIKTYRKGNLSRAELALALYDGIDESTLSNSKDLLKFKRGLARYLDSKGIFKEQAYIDELLKNESFVHGTSYTWGVSSLQLAVVENEMTLVKKLLKRNADSNVTDRNGFTPLHIAVACGYTDTVEILLAAKAKVNVTNQDGVTPLWLAACYSHTEAMKKLLDYQVDIALMDKYGNSPLDVAVIQGNEKIVRMLTIYNENAIQSQDQQSAIEHNENFIPAII